MGLFANLLQGGQVGGGGNGVRTLATPSGGKSSTNMEIGINEALSLGPWFAAHRIKSDQFAKTSFELFKRLPRGGREPAKKHPKYKLLMRRPNKQQNAFVYKQHIYTHRFFDGNMYSFVADNGSLIEEIIPLSPWRVRVKQKVNGDLYYEYHPDFSGGKVLLIPAENMMHWIGPTLDGLVGMGMIRYAANQIGIAIKEEKHKEHLLDNQGVPQGVLTVPGKLSEKDFNDTLEKLKRYEGPENSGKTMLLDNGTTYERSGLTPAELGFNGNDEAGIIIASQFTGVSPILLGDTNKASFHNMNEANRQFLEYGMDPDFISFELLCNDRLLSEAEKNDYFWEFDRSEFEKMDPEKTSIILNNGRNGGYLSANDCRAAINKSPLPPEIGDTYLRPENMAPADAPYEKAAPPANPKTVGGNDQSEEKKPKKETKSTNNSQIKEAFSGVFGQVFGRMTTKADNNCQRLAKKSTGSDLTAAVRDLMVESVESYTSELTPSVFSFARVFGDIPVGLEAQLKTFTRLTVDRLATSFINKAELYTVGNFKTYTAEQLGQNASEELLTLIEAYYANEV